MRILLYHKVRIILVLILISIMSSTLMAQVRQQKTTTITVSVALKVTDENGNPVPNANVIIGEGITYTQTDKNGLLTINAYPNDFVTINATGYEKNVSQVKDIVLQNNVRLIKSKLFMTSDDNIQLPFITMKKRMIAGNDFILSGNQLDKYPTTDIRNSFIGLVPGLQITERNGSPGLTPEEELGVYSITGKIGVSSRGRSMKYIIDNIPLSITEMPLDPSEIETVSVIKDITGKTMYGPLAADGIIMITTKRGRANERILNVNLESGISIIDRFPGTVSGEDYAKLNNSARVADGLNPRFSSSDIAEIAKNDPYDMYHPSVNYRDMMLKNTRGFRRANVSSTGGNEVARYYAYLGYNGEGDIYKIGPAADYNRIATRSNIDLKVNRLIDTRFDFYAGLSFRRSANYMYSSTITEGGAAMSLLEFNQALPYINTTPPVEYPVYANNDPSLPKPYYAVNAAYPNNPIGDLVHNGYYTELGRTGSLSATIDINLSDLIEGLKSSSSLTYDGLNVVRIGKAENYEAYMVTPSKTAGNQDTILLAKVHDGVDAPEMSNLHDYYYQGFMVFENLSYNRSFGKHDIQSALTYHLFRIARDGIEEPQRTQSVVWTGVYSFNDKYSIVGVLNYAGTYTLPKKNRSRLFPSVGATWVISEENFMSGISFIDFLKLHANAGILGFENFQSPFYFRSHWTVNSSGTVFGAYSTNRWFGSTTSTAYRTSPSRIGNPDITWETRKEFSLGIDGLMFNHKLSFELSYFNNLRNDIVTQLSSSTPYYLGISAVLPRYNSNKYRYYGFESGIQFSDNSRSLKYSVGGNATIMRTKYVKIDEPQYRFDYQYRTGRPIDTYWGLKYEGKFSSDQEALSVHQAYDAVLKKGDLKYTDMNGDGYIDDNDMSAIGRTTPLLYYSLFTQLSYRNFNLSVLGSGCAFYDIPMTNRYYWSGWGDNNYTNFVKDNIGGAYPRLTYYKVNNNFIASDFWLTNGNFFKIQNVELAYNVPLDKLHVIHSRGMRLFIRGANLLTLSGVKDVDPESINSGVTVYPLYKTFTGGVKLTF